MCKLHKLEVVKGYFDQKGLHKLVVYPEACMMVNGVHAVHFSEIKYTDGKIFVHDFWGREIDLHKLVDLVNGHKGGFGNYEMSRPKYTFNKVTEDGGVEYREHLSVDTAEEGTGFAGYVYYSPESGPFISMTPLFKMDDGFGIGSEDPLVETEVPYAIRFYA